MLDEHQWRWMLGLEAIPAILYYFGLFFVPNSPRWLILKGRFDDAKRVMTRFSSAEEAEREINSIKESIENQVDKEEGKVKDLLRPGLRLVLLIGIVVAVLQQITGINSVFFYAPMIFEQSGIGTDASFIQAILVGLTNLVFTVIALLTIDKLGRKPLLAFGVAGIALCMFLLAYGFSSATYSLTAETIAVLPETVDQSSLEPLIGTIYNSDIEFQGAMVTALGPDIFSQFKTDLVTAAISMNPMLILFAILGFVASFAISIGPVMWVLFSELFPNKIRGIAISFVGLINSAVSFIVQWVFPWELDTLGNVLTFTIYGVFAALGFIFIIRVIPETKGKSLEEIEAQLVKED